MAAGTGKSSTHPAQRHTPGPGHPRAGHTIRINDPRSTGLAGDPELLTETAATLASLLPADTEALAGPALAGIPLVTAVSLHTGLPAAFLRPAPKEHGTWQQIEGTKLGGRRTVLLDDTARSGASLLRSARLLRIGGARVGTAVCVLDRDAGATTLLAGHHIILRALVCDPGGAQ